MRVAIYAGMIAKEEIRDFDPDVIHRAVPAKRGKYA